MHVGVLQFVTPRGVAIGDLAAACEQRGLESLWVPEHPVVPVDYKTRYPLSADGKLPRPYTELPDPFPVLAAAAAATKRLRLGTGICLVPERDALMTALQVATVDWISNGRFLFGIGAGWLEEEMRLFTPHFAHRFAFMKEAIAAMRAVWAEDGAAFDGKWVKFPPVVCRPKPVQQPGPPVIIGGMGPNVLKRVGTYGDGWMPIGLAPDGIAQARRDIERFARDAGRDPSKITLTVMMGAPPGMEEDATAMLPPREIVAAYRDAGADRLVVSIPTLPADGTYVHLDRVARAMP
jgi:probable F420-dependent oxidoreductase